MELADDADIAMTQQEVNTMCPFTRKEMSNPVTNQICRHSYEKEGILQHIKSRGKRAKYVVFVISTLYMMLVVIPVENNVII